MAKIHIDDLECEVPDSELTEVQGGFLASQEYFQRTQIGAIARTQVGAIGRTQVGAIGRSAAAAFE